MKNLKYEDRESVTYLLEAMNLVKEMNAEIKTMKAGIKAEMVEAGAEILTVDGVEVFALQSRNYSGKLDKVAVEAELSMFGSSLDDFTGKGRKGTAMNVVKGAYEALRSVLSDDFAEAVSSIA